MRPKSVFSFPRFGRALLIAVISLLLLGTMWLVARYLRNDAAIRAVESAGGTVTIEPVGAKWMHLGDGNKRLRAFGTIVEVNLANASVDDQFFAKTEMWSSVKRVMTTSQFMTDDSVSDLAKLPRLDSLWLIGASVTDRGVADIATVSNLRTLCLDGTRVTDAGLVHLAGHQRLKNVSLDETAITDAGLQHLSKIPNLESLTLMSTRITDSGVPSMIRMSKLKNLDLSYTFVTSVGLSQLHDNLPGCAIQSRTEE